ncbi:hypothetical protein POVWA1_065300 [Plasmodium ovale wallikeri]|uniref:Uncharacterized protein n=1 Tax=Plasmodium ovale wallikeri TaxID=864142 RepID=A0A1A9ACX5_PLAOA|nr:hypothetical protein POVWA1_065300 [Plasmodium ovale wallikeri]
MTVCACVHGKIMVNHGKVSLVRNGRGKVIQVMVNHGKVSQVRNDRGKTIGVDFLKDLYTTFNPFYLFK